MLECITPNSIRENTFNSTKKYLQFDFRQSESLFKVFTSLHSIDFKSTKKYLQTRRWLEVSQKVFDPPNGLSCREATKAERVLGNGAFEEQSALVNINGGRCIFVRITQILILLNTNTEENTTTNTLAHVAGEQSGAVKIIGAASLSRQCTPFTWICEQVFQLCGPGTNLFRQILWK